MYSLTAYGRMIADRARRRAYAGALEQAVRPGCSVLDLGAGPGVFALLAARLGAAEVYAVEPDDSIEVARRLAAAHGLDDRVRFFRGRSADFEAAEKVDVVVSDLRGTLPLFQDHLPSIIDARRRLLKQDGVLIPRKDRLWATVIEAGELHERQVGTWADNELGLDFAIPREMVSHASSQAWIGEPDRCLVTPECWTSLDYRSVEKPDVHGGLEWRVTRAGTAHGLLLWFDTELAAGIGFSNAPGQPRLIYEQRFFPFPEAVELEAGDSIAVRLDAVLAGRDYTWRWATSIERRARCAVRFDQSTFFAEPLSGSKLKKRAASYVPELTTEGRIAAFALERMDGRSSLETIARELRAAFPSRFGSWRQALDLVGRLADGYG